MHYYRPRYRNGARVGIDSLQLVRKRNSVERVELVVLQVQEPARHHFSVRRAQRQNCGGHPGEQLLDGKGYSLRGSDIVEGTGKNGR